MRYGSPRERSGKKSLESAVVRWLSMLALNDTSLTSKIKKRLKEISFPCQLRNGVRGKVIFSVKSDVHIAWCWWTLPMRTLLCVVVLQRYQNTICPVQYCFFHGLHKTLMAAK